MRFSFACFRRFLIPLLLTQFALAQQNPQNMKKLQEEERQDYYKKWLNEVVIYIITPEEKAVFLSLTTPEEKEQFIEQFWSRRDTDPSTAVNEFKEEHYRRIAYANERFESGYRGWLTDRGRIYIIHGKPDEITSYPAGGPYTRPLQEGGGKTVTFPFEIWRYRNIEGVGSDIELEFADSTQTGEYKLTFNPFEKDALAHTPGSGETMLEQQGLATRSDRQAYVNPSLLAENRQIEAFMRVKDTPFERYKTYAKVSRPPALRHKELQEVVNVNISYSNLPFTARYDYLRLNEEETLVPITLAVENKELTFKQENGIYKAKIALYGLIKSITGQIVQEFEEDLILPLPSTASVSDSRSIHQKVVVLGQKLRYRIDLVMKDLNSGKTGVVQAAIVPPSQPEGRLSTSSLIISDVVQKLADLPTGNQAFVLGDMEVRPSVKDEFPPEGPLWAYLQVYNCSLDQSTLSPLLRVTYRVSRQARRLFEVIHENNESTDWYSQRRTVLVSRLPFNQLAPGDYTVDVEIRDRISGQVATATSKIRILSTREEITKAAEEKEESR